MWNIYRRVFDNLFGVYNYVENNVWLKLYIGAYIIYGYFASYKLKLNAFML